MLNRHMCKPYRLSKKMIIYSNNKYNNMNSEKKIIVIVGFPASGKSTYSKKLATKYSKHGIILSRDTLGGAIIERTFRI
jgi:adenylylsulfate kinase-like enzyme